LVWTKFKSVCGQVEFAAAQQVPGASIGKKFGEAPLIGYGNDSGGEVKEAEDGLGIIERGSLQDKKLWAKIMNCLGGIGVESATGRPMAQGSRIPLENAGGETFGIIQ
jgi:hypothetical protein